MKLEYRTNNAYDAVLLVDDTGMVRSDWTVTPDVLRDFCDCSQDAADWDDRFGAEHKAGEYGRLLAVRTGHELRVTGDAARTEWAERVASVLH